MQELQKFGIKLARDQLGWNFCQSTLSIANAFEEYTTAVGEAEPTPLACVIQQLKDKAFQDLMAVLDTWIDRMDPSDPNTTFPDILQRYLPAMPPGGSTPVQELFVSCTAVFKPLEDIHYKLALNHAKSKGKSFVRATFRLRDFKVLLAEVEIKIKDLCRKYRLVISSFGQNQSEITRSMEKLIEISDDKLKTLADERQLPVICEQLSIHERVQMLPPSLRVCFGAFVAFPEGALVPEPDLKHLLASLTPLRTIASLEIAEQKLELLVQWGLVSKFMSDGEPVYNMSAGAYAKAIDLYENQMIWLPSGGLVTDQTGATIVTSVD